MPAISFPQALAIAKGANYSFPAKFPGIDLKTLLSTTTAIRLNQPSFVLNNSVPNLINSAAVFYTLASSTTVDDSKLVYKTGGNLVDSAMRWSDGRTLGNWIQTQVHGGSPTAGTVTLMGKMLKVASGPQTTGLTRSLIHDTTFTRNGSTTGISSVVGWLCPWDKVNTTFYYKGFVDFNTLCVTPNTLDSERMTTFTTFVGWRYAHSQGTLASNTTLPIIVGATHGIGFMPIFNTGTGRYTWHAVYIDSNEIDSPDIIFSFNTDVSPFSSHRLKINYNNSVVTWFIDDMNTPVATKDLLSIPTNSNPGSVHMNFTTLNGMYACVMAIKGSVSGTFQEGSAIIYVEELATWREFWGGKTGLTATLTAGQNTVTLTGGGNTTGLSPGMRITKTSGTGAFASSITQPVGVFIQTISSSTQFTVVGHRGATDSAFHATTGSVVFSAGNEFAYNNFEDTNTEITTTETQYHNTGVQLLKKLK
jgi:hypothetical protein